MSHNNLLLARIARQCEEIERLLRVGAAVSALTLAGFEGNAGLFEDRRRWVTMTPYETRMAEEIASWTRAEARWTPRRLQDSHVDTHSCAADTIDTDCAAAALPLPPPLPPPLPLPALPPPPPTDQGHMGTCYMASA